MKRALALSITTLLLPLATVAAESSSSTRYSLLRVEAATTPAPASRYRVSNDAAAATAAGRFRLLGTDASKATGDVCESGDELFADGFEN